MQFEQREIDGIQVLKVVEKRIDLGNHLELKGEITRLVRKGAKYLILDLGLVQLVDSSALGIIILCSRGACGECPLVLCNLHRKIISIFKAAKLETLLLLADDIESAVGKVLELQKEAGEVEDTPANVDAEVETNES
ncbi:MAG: STAS domain-containing protein [Desulfovibrio sp.]|uniref:STAS domain-containing protein n=1 Tax=Desulfovibrio sp. 7SRBS1 TaxID=3378064 RepID=UPI003B3FB866